MIWRICVGRLSFARVLQSLRKCARCETRRDSPEEPASNMHEITKQGHGDDGLAST